MVKDFSSPDDLDDAADQLAGRKPPSRASRALWKPSSLVEGRQLAWREESGFLLRPIALDAALTCRVLAHCLQKASRFSNWILSAGNREMPCFLFSLPSLQQSFSSSWSHGLALGCGQLPGLASSKGGDREGRREVGQASGSGHTTGLLSAWSHASQGCSEVQWGR